MIELIEVEKTKSTGPIDDPREEDAGLCPKCGADALFYYPEQSGPCHSGDFINHWEESYWCAECEALFIENVVSK